MAEARQWTDEQKRAIHLRDHTILLSAAAGSGKSSVLAERIITAMTTDEGEKLDVTRLLAVTFTRAAAAELREKIASAISDRIRTTPNDAHLLRQMRLLPMAQISTIDSFCGELVRRYATRAGVSEGYRVADAQETDLTNISLMEGLIEDAYAGTIPHISRGDFADFASRMYDVREEADMGETLLALFDRMETLEGGPESLFTFADSYLRDASRPLMETDWGKRLRRACTEVGEHFLDELDTLLAEEPLDEPSLAYYDAYLNVHRGVLLTLASPTTSYRELQRLPATVFPHANSKKGVVMPASVRALFTTFRNDYLRGTLAHYLSYTEEEWQTLFSSLARYTTLLAHLAVEFSRRGEQESRRRGCYSFAQIERLAYRLLIENGKRTPLAEALSGEYDMVCVDEYQDVSPIQHAIFAAVAGERCRFLVGDIKQSIYRFRHADPSIFARLRDSLPPLDEAPDAPGVSLFMSKNFRCDEPVVTYVNHVFDTLFRYAGGDIKYTSEDRLGFGKSTKNVTYTPLPTLAVFETKKGGVVPVKPGAALSNGLPDPAAVAGGEDNPVPDPDAKDEVAEGDISREAMWVAGKIHELLESGKRNDGITAIKPSDIAILLRKRQNRVLPYLEALAAFGIPAATPEATDFFTCPEVLLALSLLRTIDNPLRDISLAAVLLSPLYRMSADDLVRIRRAGAEGVPLYHALTAYCSADPHFEKGHFFLRQLADFRDAAERISVARLIRRLLSETPLMTIAGADGKGGDVKLRLLYHYALRHSGEGEGLYSFIHYINRQLETGKTFSPPTGNVKSDGVSVMTIHSSKGLEFPVVFLADCGSGFSRRDTEGHFIFDGFLPPAFRMRDETGLVKVDNPVRHLVAESISEMSAEEEMRLLYVALTRAREQLYVSGSLPPGKKVAEALEKAARDALAPTRFKLMMRKSYLSLLLVCAAREPHGVELLRNPEVREAIRLLPEEGEAPPPDPIEVMRLAAEYRSRFTYTYPYAHLTRIPGKLSVSRLTPSLLDGTEEETARLNPPVEPPQDDTADTHEKYRRMPRAWAGVRPPDPTERGIVSHQFLQFCDFARLKELGVAAELARLVERGYLSEEDAKLVRPEELESFRSSRLLDEMLSAREVMREFRFHVRLPAARFTADPALAAQFGEEMLLVQGVMDALIIDPDGSITLVDYKTDRLTRAELANPALAAKKLTDRHAPQLRYYAGAVESVFGAPPARVLIYSLHLGDHIALHLD